MSSLDEIKDKLKLDEMDEETRKQMFQKFINKGGQVIKEKPKSTQRMKFNRERQIELQQNIAKQDETIRQKYGKSSRNINRLASHSGIIYKNNYSIIDFFKGVFAGLYTLNGKFNKKFLLKMHTEFPEIVSSLNFLASQMVKLDKEKKWALIDNINNIFPLSYELILRFYNLYKMDAISNLKDYFTKYTSIKCKSIISDMEIIYKDLVLLLPYWETNKDVLWKSIVQYEKLSKEVGFLPRGKINRYIDRLFNYYLPYFHMILTYNKFAKVEYNHEKMKLFANIQKNKDIGYISQNLVKEKAAFLKELEEEKKERKKALAESLDKKEMEKIPEHIKKGLKIIDNIIEKLPELRENDDKLKLFENNEKMMILYVLFMEYDKQYSFLLTTSQLELNTRLESGIRTDIRTEFDEAFIKFNEVTHFIKEYIDLLEELQNIRLQLEDNGPLLRRKEEAINVKRIQVLNEVKGRGSNFLRKIIESLQKLIHDYRSDQLLLQNPEEKLNFPLSREKKKFQGIPIINTIGAAYSFSSAILYYISHVNTSQKKLYLDDDAFKKKEQKNSDTSKDKQ